jgi:hypothetical protein
LERLAFLKIPADGKNNLVFPNRKILACEKRMIRPTVGVRAHLQNQFLTRGTPSIERDPEPSGWPTGCEIQNMRGQLSHLLPNHSALVEINKAGKQTSVRASNHPDKSVNFGNFV